MSDVITMTDIMSSYEAFMKETQDIPLVLHCDVDQAVQITNLIWYDEGSLSMPFGRVALYYKPEQPKPEFSR